MIAWIGWIIFALIPGVIAVLTAMSLQTMALLYFGEVAFAIVAWGIWDKIRRRKPEEI